MKSFQRNKGVTLTILVITIVVILLLTGTVALNIKGVIEVKKLNSMYNDIQILQEKVNNYYQKNNALPVYNKLTIDVNSIIGSDKNANDNENYYKININLIENISLNYGHQRTENDYYIINEQSHVVYYLNGIEANGKIHYTLKSNDKNIIGTNYGIDKFPLKAEPILGIVELTDYQIKVSADIPEDTQGISGYKYKINEEPWTDLQTKNGYTFVNLDRTKSYKVSMMIVDNEGSETYAINNGAEVKAKEELANEPAILDTGLEPVRFNTDGSIKYVTDISSKWYNYQEQLETTVNGGTSEWANAVTKNKDGKVTGYWVWIPRYAYKITYYTNEAKTTLSANNGTTKTSYGTIDVVFLKGTTDDYYDSDGKKLGTAKRAGQVGAGTTEYLVHPAFTNENNSTEANAIGSATNNGYKNGGWDKETTGFWVAKFPAGFAGGNNDITASDSNIAYLGTTASANYYGVMESGTTKIKYPVFLPKTYAYNYISSGDSYRISREIQNASDLYKLNNTKVDSHLMKNSEWGAVAYLTHSKYGRNGTEVTINNVDLNNTVPTIAPVTGYATNNANTSINTFSSKPDFTGNSISNGTLTSYAWNTNEGKLGSSTGNLYGIYDLSGCVWEAVAGYIPVQDTNNYITQYGEGLAWNESSIILTNNKYSNAYKYNGSGATNTSNYSETPNPTRKGEAIWEISTNGNGATSWNADTSNFSYSSEPFAIRGGSYNNGTGAGAFAFYYTKGAPYVNYGFRTALMTF